MSATEAAAVTSSHRLSTELNALVESLDGQDTTLGEILDRIAHRGFGLLLMVLALPAALPIPAPGYATPFGLLMVGLAVQLIMRRQTPALPERARKRVIKYSFFAWTVKNAGFPLRIAEFLVRPRLRRVATSPVVQVLVGVIIVAMSAFMILPIPLTNTAPSFVIFVLACGLLEEDGLLLVAGVLLAPVAAVIAIVSLYFVFTVGLGAAEGAAKSFLRGLAGGGQTVG